MNKFSKILSVLVLILSGSNLFAAAAPTAAMTQEDKQILIKYNKIAIELLKKYYTDAVTANDRERIKMLRHQQPTPAAITNTGLDTLNSWDEKLLAPKSKLDLHKIKTATDACFAALLKLWLFNIKANPELNEFGITNTNFNFIIIPVINKILASPTQLNNEQITTIIFNNLPDNMQEYIQPLTQPREHITTQATEQLKQTINHAKYDFYTSNSYVAFLFINLMQIKEMFYLRQFALIARSTTNQAAVSQLDESVKFVLKCIKHATLTKFTELLKKSTLLISEKTKLFYLSPDKKSFNKINLRKSNTSDKLGTIIHLLNEDVANPAQYMQHFMNLFQMLGVDMRGDPNKKAPYYVENNTEIELNDEQLKNVFKNIGIAYSHLVILKFMMIVFKNDLSPQQQQEIHLKTLKQIISNIPQNPNFQNPETIESIMDIVNKQLPAKIKKENSEGFDPIKIKHSFVADFIKFYRYNMWLVDEWLRLTVQFPQNIDVTKDKLIILNIHMKHQQQAPFYSVVEKLITNIKSLINSKQPNVIEETSPTSPTTQQ